MKKQGSVRSRQLLFRRILYVLIFSVTFLGYLYYMKKKTEDAELFRIGLVVFAVLLVLFIVVEVLSRTKVFHVSRRKNEAEPVFKSITLDFMQKLDLPVVITDERSKIIWFNPAFGQMFHANEALQGRFLDQFTSVSIENVCDAEGTAGVSARLKQNRREEYENHVFAVRGYPVIAQKTKYFVTFWEDRSDYQALEDRLEREDDVVALIVIDNLDELLQIAPEKFRIAAAHAETVLRRFAESVHGILREYETDKFILVFKNEYLPAIVENKFSVMDEVREIHADENNGVTLSIGAAKVPGTLAEKEQAARIALETALQRGGDQAVLRTTDDMEFYGGKTKTVHKRTKVRARVIAKELAARIAQAENVIIMGHRFPDHDCIGSCVGLARLCMFCGVDVKIAADRNDGNIAPCLEVLEDDPDYRYVFVSPTEISQYIRPGTLLIISDVSAAQNFEVPELYENVRDCVIVDHHRRAGDLAYPPLLSYIEPSASSASELVAEILELATPLGTVKKTEADLLLSGILLDTDRFTRNTGVRTFAAAVYLRGEGAEPADAKLLFRSSFEDFDLETKFRSNIRIFRDRYAIAYRDVDGAGSHDCIVAAKTANKLLSLQNVSASFALVRVGGQIHISARSLGEINVQLILESLGGGGHFDAAAAKLDETDMEKAIGRLTEAIDNFSEVH